LEALADLGLRKKKDGKKTVKAKKARVIMTAANGKAFTHADAIRLSKYDRIVFLCGRYEGIDQRVIDHLCDESFRIGEYVLTGGELPAMVMMDAIARQIPGVLGKEESLEEESWAPPSPRRTGLRGTASQEEKSAIRNPQSIMPGTGEYPQYTRPEVWLGHKVPEVLMSGNHQKIKEWRRGQRGDRESI
jgi:tRNA (guanine37-N1)-methyltransferase